MSRHGRRRTRSGHTHRSQEVTSAGAERSSAPEPLEIREESDTIAMSLASDECHEDRPDEMLEVPGVVLRQHREARGLTLDDISRTTKINKPALRALEASDPLHLPAAIYTRGFVKAYAREVGLPPDQTADEYLRRIEPLRAQHLLVDDGVPPPLAEVPRPVDANDDARHLLAENQMRRVSRLTLIGAAIGLVVYLASFHGDQNRPAAETEAVERVGDAAPAGGMAPDAAGDDVTSAALNDEPLRFDLQPQGPCWVSVSVGGETVFAKLLKAGDRATVHVPDEAVVRVGEPGALSYSINGHAGRALGPAGVPVTVRIGKDNFRNFLSS